MSSTVQIWRHDKDGAGRECSRAEGHADGLQGNRTRGASYPRQRQANSHSKTGNTKSNPVEANTELDVKQNDDGRYSSDQRLMRFRGRV